MADDYATAVLCEAIVGYHLYGTIGYRNGKYMYPSWVTKKLDLRRYKHKNTESSVVTTEFMFSDVLRLYDNGYNTPLLVLMKWETNLGIELLQSVPTKDFVTTGINRTVNIVSELAKKPLLSQNYGQEDDVSELQLDMSVDFLISCLKHSVYEYFLKKKPIDGKYMPWNEFYDKANSWKRVKLVTSFEFVTQVFENEGGTTNHSFVRWLIDLLIWAENGSRCLEPLKLKLAIKIEKLLLDEKSGFVFPVSEQVQFHRLLVLPAAGIRALPEDKTEDTQHQISWLYMRWSQGLKVEVDGIYRALKSSNGWKTETPMTDILNRMVEESIVPRVILI